MFTTEGFFDAHITQQLIRAKWTCIPYSVVCSPSSTGYQATLTPDMRGGHQMCIDSNGGQLYLCGGWDGSKELGDLWKFTIQTNNWTCLSRNTAQEVCSKNDQIFLNLHFFSYFKYRVDRGQNLVMLCVLILIRELSMCLVVILRLHQDPANLIIHQ